MPRVVRETSIARPPEQVFAALTDPKARASWVATLREDPVPHPLRKGDKVSAVRRRTTTGSRYTLTVVALDAPHKLAMDVARNGTHVGKNTFELRAEAAGTRVVATTEFELTGLQRMMTPVVTATMEKEISEELDALKRHVESIP